MKSLLLLALCLGPYCEAFAKDSDWKICKGDSILYGERTKIIMNVYEHRNANGRTANMAFIYGGNILRGSLNTTDSTSGAIKLQDGKSLFKGAVVLDYPISTLSISGKVT